MARLTFALLLGVMLLGAVVGKFTNSYFVPIANYTSSDFIFIYENQIVLGIDIWNGEFTGVSPYLAFFTIKGINIILGGRYLVLTFLCQNMMKLKSLIINSAQENGTRQSCCHINAANCIAILPLNLSPSKVLKYRTIKLKKTLIIYLQDLN